MGADQSFYPTTQDGVVSQDFSMMEELNKFKMRKTFWWQVLTKGGAGGGRVSNVKYVNNVLSMKMENLLVAGKVLRKGLGIGAGQQLDNVNPKNSNKYVMKWKPF